MRGIETRILLVPLALTLLAAFSSGQQSPADVILLNGKIFTSDSAHPYVEALAIQGERIVATGSAEKVRRKSAESVALTSINARDKMRASAEIFLQRRCPRDREI